MMKRQVVLIAAAALLLGAGVAMAGEPLEVGSSAPEFTLAGGDGIEHGLSGLRGEQAAVVIFFRGLW